MTTFCWTDYKGKRKKWQNRRHDIYCKKITFVSYTNDYYLLWVIDNKKIRRQKMLTSLLLRHLHCSWRWSIISLLCSRCADKFWDLSYKEDTLKAHAVQRNSNNTIGVTHLESVLFRVHRNTYFIIALPFNPLTAILFNPNFHPLEVVSRWRDPQLQVSENYSDLTKWRSTVFRYCWLMSHFISNMFKRWYLMCW